MLPHPVWTTIFKRAAPLVKVLDVQSDATDLTIYTFTAVNLGDIGSTASQADTFGINPHQRSTGRKMIAIIIHGEDAATVFSVSSVTLGGVAGTERVDRGGGTSAVNSAIYTWDTTAIAGIANTDVVVTWDEAVTACAIGVVSIENIGVIDQKATSNTQGTGSLVMTAGSAIAGYETYGMCLGGSTCAGPTETFEISTEGSATGQGSVDAMLLYEGSNAEMAFAAFWSYYPGYPYDNTPFRFVGTWSGAGAGDAVITVFA